jgi:iron complex outermembrane recepter protein
MKRHAQVGLYCGAILFLVPWLSAEDTTNDTLEITTTGGPRPLLAVPAAVQVNEQVEDDRAWWIGETLNQIPGVYVAQLRGVIDAPSLRMPLTFKNYYLYLTDGVPVQSTIMYNAKAFAYSGATANPAAIEVSKGPGSALYGSDAFAGIIHVRSQPPSAITTATIRAGRGTYGGRFAQGTIGGAINNNNTMTATVHYDGEDGWRDHSAWQRLQGIACHRWSAGSTTIDTSLIATQLHTEMTGQLAPTVYHNNPRDDGLAPTVPLDEAQDNATYLRLSSAVRTRLNQFTAIEIIPYVRQIDNTYMEVFNPATTPRDTEFTRTAGSLQRIRLSPSARTNVIIGMDVDWTRLNFLVEQSRPTTAVNGLNSYQGKHYDFTVDSLIIAPYIHAEHWWGTRVVSECGLRCDWASYDYRDHLGPTTDPNDFVYRPASRTDYFSHVSPKAGVSYLLTDNQAIFLRYAQGFRLPAADSLYVLRNGQTAFTLEPETADSFEVGWKGQHDNIFQWEIDGYLVTARDGIVDNVVTSAGTISTNGGTRQYRGIESGLKTEIYSTTDIYLAYSYTQHDIIRYRSDGPNVADGKTPAGAPQNIAYARLTHRPIQSLALSLEGQWIGSWYLDDNNTARTADVVLCHARATWQMTTQWELEGKILNLFDTPYAATAQRFSYGDRYRPGQPFTAYAGLTFHY